MRSRSTSPPVPGLPCLATAAALVALLAGPSGAEADPEALPNIDTRGAARSETREPIAAKKDRFLALKSSAATAAESRRQEARKRAWERQLDRRIGRKPAPVINIYNTWTHEFITVDPSGKLPSQETVNEFLRCHFSNEPTDMEPRLFATLAAAASHFKARRIDIVSGFRSPKYNLILRKKGREVSRKSQHTHGRAVDFRLPGVNVKRLHEWARQLRLGGVGYYAASGFIHIDTGRIRYWSGR